MNEIEILSEEKRQAIKKMLNALDVGLSNFQYACICNHRKGDKITGFEGRGNTDSFAVLSLLNDIWNDLTDKEKNQVQSLFTEGEE